MLFTLIRVHEESSFLGCCTFKMKLRTQTGKLMESKLTFMFYIAATAFHFPLGRINMTLTSTWNLYTSDPQMGAPLHISLPSTCFHSGLPWAVTETSGNSTKPVTLVNRIHGILPCLGDDSIGGVIAKAFFKVKYFWRAVGLLVNMYWCIHCYWSAVIGKIFCAWTVKRGTLWECRMWRRVFLGTFDVVVVLQWPVLSLSVRDCPQQGFCGAGPRPCSPTSGRSWPLNKLQKTLLEFAQSLENSWLDFAPKLKGKAQSLWCLYWLYLSHLQTINFHANKKSMRSPLTIISKESHI